MQETNTRDFLVGLFVLGGILILAYLSFSIGGLNYSGAGGLELTARFDQISGLKSRAPVEIAGVRVGQVTSISLDEEQFRAVVWLDVDEKLKLPVDSTAAIVTAGILGDRYVSIDLGAEEEFLRSGEEIAYTESALVLERMIGKFLYNVESDDEDN